MASKLEIVGGDGSTFNWYSPQDGMELIHPVKLLALAMRDKLPFTTPPDNFYDGIKSVYEMIWRFRENTRLSFSWYVRRDIAIGDDVPASDPESAWLYDWGSLGVAIGEDLTFFKDMTFDKISYIQTGTIFPKNLLTIMYKIVHEMSLYRARYGQIPMESYSQDWVGYQDDNNNWVHYFQSNLNDPTGSDTQNGAYNSLLSYINNNANYGNRNFHSNGLILTPRRIGGYYRSTVNQDQDLYRFYLNGWNGTQSYPNLAKTFHFAYIQTRSDGFQDIYSAGDFNNTFPDATTEYYQYVYSTKNGTGFNPTNYHNFGGGFLENKISHIQQAYSADGYILRTDNLAMDFSTVPNEVPASYGCQIKTLLSFNINEPRFTDYYTEPTP